MAEKQLTGAASALCEAIAAELERQHEDTGIHGLVVSRTEEAGVVNVHGPLDLHAVTEAVMRHSLGGAYKALVGYDPFEDDPTQTVEGVRDLLNGVAQEHRNAELSKLRDAEQLIRDLDSHEGAEGWSADLRQRLDAYHFATKAEG